MTIALAAIGLSDAHSAAAVVANATLNLSHPKVVVVKSTKTLYLFDAPHLVRAYPIILGPDPAGQKTRAGDGKTPEGNFTICTKNRHSPNRRFLGISYPDPAAADRGLASGMITAGERDAIHHAARHGGCPPWNTALGGAIGLHGGADRIGRTAGCIALHDADIDELFGVLRTGDPIEVLP